MELSFLYGSGFFLANYMVVVNYMNKENFLLGHLFKVSDLAPEVLLKKKRIRKESTRKLLNPKKIDLQRNHLGC
jgi:hypothetical protein